MPASAEILEGLARIANGAFGYAVAWHVALALILFGAIAGWKPTKRLIAFLLAAPVVSASAFAWLYGNPFNGSVLAIVALAMGIAAWRAPEEPLDRAPPWARTLGFALVAFAWIYPHFLEDRSPFAYLVGAPMGLIPCPSLSLAVGLSLVAGNPGGRRQAYVLALAGIFYAVFGALRLGVWIDLVLLAGAAALVVAQGRPRTATGTARSTVVPSPS